MSVWLSFISLLVFSWASSWGIWRWCHPNVQNSFYQCWCLRGDIYIISHMLLLSVSILSYFVSFSSLKLAMTGFSVISFYLFIEICNGKSTLWEGMKNDLYPQEPEKWKNCEMEPTVFRPYPWRLECLRICRCRKKGSTFSLVILKSLALIWRWVWTCYLSLSRLVLSYVLTMQWLLCTVTKSNALRLVISWLNWWSQFTT